MERRNKEMKQSSLPSSLIPHLYSRPQQSDSVATTPFPTLPLPSVGVQDEANFSERAEFASMRTSFTLPPVASSFGTPLPAETHHGPHYMNYDSRHLLPAIPNLSNPTVSPVDIPSSGIVRSMGSLSLPSHISSQRYASPIFSDPHYRATRSERMFQGMSQNYLVPPYQEALHPRGAWQEGEAGPSSLVHAPYDPRNRGRRGSSQPAQLTRQTEPYNIRADVSDGDGEGYPGGGGESYPGTTGRSSQGGYYTPWSERFQETVSHTSHLGSDTASSSQGYQQFPLTSVNISHRGWTGTHPTSGYSDPPGYSPSSVSDASSDGRDDDGDDSYNAVQKGKKRRRDSEAGEEDSTRKSRTTRKTAVACNFCRGRKLRCNGAKPACSNCTVRRFQCEYVPVQRRRGPGKAPKGNKMKKGSTTGRSEPSMSVPPDHGSVAVAEGAESTADNYSIHRSPPRQGPSRRRGGRSTSPSADSDPEKRY